MAAEVQVEIEVAVQFRVAEAGIDVEAHAGRAEGAALGDVALHVDGGAHEGDGPVEQAAFGRSQGARVAGDPRVVAVGVEDVGIGAGGDGDPAGGEEVEGGDLLQLGEMPGLAFERVAKGVHG